jgi:Ca-activated chloride channel homolog
MMHVIPGRFILLLFLLSTGFVSVLAQNKIQQVVPGKTRILFVLDGSGSMEAAWDSEQSRMDVAKSILTRLVDSLRINPDLEIALRVYGHQSHRSLNNCQDSRLEVPFGIKNHSAIISKIKTITPKGTTPITYSIGQAAKDFSSTAGYRNILILITDGVESCGGDPCEVSRELQKKGVFLRPYIIGLGLKGGTVLDCVGKFIDSENASSFNKILNKSIETSLAKTTVSVELLNSQHKPLETDIDVSFVNSITRTPAYEFVHYRDKIGRPDSVQVDPVVLYDIVVNTIPPIIQKNVDLTAGKHNTITIEAPQGSLVGKSEGKGNPFSFVVREKGKSEILNVQRSGEYYRYLQGEYEVETFTLPKRIVKLSITGDQTQTISLPATGLVNINTLLKGIGTLFEILETGETKWVCHLNENTSIHSYNLLPGKYRLAFRTKQAAGSKYTAIKDFEVKSGVTLNLNMFK